MQLSFQPGKIVKVNQEQFDKIKKYKDYQEINVDQNSSDLSPGFEDGKIIKVSQEQFDKIKKYKESFLNKNQEESDFTQKAASLGKAAFSGVLGGAIDTATLPYNAVAGIHNFQQETERQKEALSPEERQRLESLPIVPNPLELVSNALFPNEVPYIPSAQEEVGKRIDQLTDGYTKTPENLKHLSEGVKFAGSLGSIGGVGKIAAKTGNKAAEKIGKFLGTTKPSELGGAVVAGATMSKANEELGPLAALPLGAAAGALTTKGLSGIKKIGEATKGTLTGKGTSLGDITLGRVLALKGEPLPEIIKIAKEYDIDLPFNIPLKSPVANFLANTALDTIFTTREYNNIIENAPKQLKNKFIEIIDKVHPEDIGKTAASRDYYSALSKQEELITQKSKELYDYAKTLLKPEDKVIPSHTINALRELKGDLSAPVPSDPMKFVINKIGKLSEAWGLLPSSLNISKEFEDQVPHLYDAIAKNLQSNVKPVSVESIIQQRSAFMTDLRNKDAYGMQRQLGRVIKALDEDISSLKNKDFINNWKAANNFYRNEVANTIRSDFSRSMLEGVFPKQAYDYMTSPAKINELERILGSSTEVEEVMGALKRAKLQKILIDPSVSSEGGVNMATFANKFAKNSENYDLLKSLLGDKSFNDLKKLSEIAKEFSSTGKRFANPSGTTTRSQDLARIGGMGAVLFSGGIGAVPLGASIVTPLVLSKLLSNPRYTNAAVNYATALKNSKNATASTYQKKMQNIFFDLAKKSTPYTINKELN